MKKILILGLALCMMISFVGCSNDAESGEVSEDTFKVALLLPGTTNDGGWNTTAYNGLMAIEKEFGAEVSYTESVPQSDMEEVFRNYAMSDFDLIIGHGFEFGDAALRVAPDYTDAIFMVTSTDISQEPNVISLLTDNQQQGFLQGVVAAIVSETGVIGGVGGMEIPPITADLQGYEAGALYARPDVEVINVMTGSFDDAASAKEQATAMIDAGADVVMHDADHAGLGVIEAADAAGVYSIGSIGVQFDLGDKVLMCGVTDMNQAFIEMAQKVVDGSIESQNYIMGVKENVVSMEMNPDLLDEVSEEDLAEINGIYEMIKSGEIVPADYLN